MKRITATELANKTNFELSALYARVKEELDRTEDGYERDVLAASLEAIRQAFTAPKIKPPRM